MINEVLAFVVMYQLGPVPCVEGMLFVAIRGGRCRPCGLECTSESVAGVDEVCLVPMQCVCQRIVYVTEKKL